MKVQCSECKKSEKFDDARDIYYAKWLIIAWLLPSGDPLTICVDCIKKPKQKKI